MDSNDSPNESLAVLPVDGESFVHLTLRESPNITTTILRVLRRLWPHAVAVVPCHPQPFPLCGGIAFDKYGRRHSVVVFASMLAFIEWDTRRDKHRGQRLDFRIRPDTEGFQHVTLVVYDADDSTAEMVGLIRERLNDMVGND